MKKTKRIAIVNHYQAKESKLEDVLTIESQRYSSFNDLQNKLDISKKNRVQIDHYNLREFLNSNIDNYDKIVIESSTGRTSQLERELISKLNSNNLQKIINFSGESIIKEEAANKSLDQIDFSEYRHLAPKILAGNKALTEILLEGHESLIERHGFGFNIPENINVQSSLPKEKMIVKPVQGSCGNGVRKVDGRTFNFNSIEDCVFGSEVAQRYIQQESVVDHNRASDLRIIVSKDDGEYKYHAMLRVGDENATCSNLSGGGFGIGIVPGRKIRGDIQRDIARTYGIDPNNPTIPKNILEYSQEFADTFNYNILGLDFVAEKTNMGTRYKLLEANSNPGARIFHYLGLTKSKKLEQFVIDNQLNKNIKLSPVDKTPALEYAKAKLLKTIHVMNAAGVDTNEIQRKLGINQDLFIGFSYEGFSDIKKGSKKEKKSFKNKKTKTYQINDFFDNSLLKNYLRANGISGRITDDRFNRRIILDKIINRNQVQSFIRNVNKSIEQGIVDSYTELNNDYNSFLGLNESNNLFENPTGLKPKQQMYKLSDELLKQAITSRKQLRTSYFKYKKAKKSNDLDEKIRLYESSLRIDPKFLKVKSNLGLMYARNGQHDKAQLTLLEVLQEDPNRRYTKLIYEKLFEEC